MKLMKHSFDIKQNKDYNIVIIFIFKSFVAKWYCKFET